MLEILLPAGIAFCTASNLIECKTLDALYAATILQPGIAKVCTDAKPCDLLFDKSCIAVSRIFFDAETAAAGRMTPGWSTWFACSYPKVGS